MTAPSGSCVLTEAQRPNPRVNRSAKQLRCLVPVALRAPAPGYAERSAPGFEVSPRFEEVPRTLFC
jgi:hypothetical protein